MAGLLAPVSGRSKYGRKRDPEKENFSIVAYVPEYRFGGLNFDFVGERTTDLILFSAEPTKSGGLHFFFAPDDLKRAQAIRESHGVRLLLCVGGGGRSGNFAHVTSDPVLMDSFVSTLLETLKKYNLQGIDFDWEQPVNQQEASLYSKLIVVASTALRPKKYLVTAALHSWQTYLSADAVNSLDRVHLMSYDNQGKHSTFASAKKDVKSILKSGFPPYKVALGFPGYGRSLSSPGNVQTYEEIVNNFSPKPAGDIAGPDSFYFNGVETVKKKTTYALKRGLAGLMLWEAGQDTKDPSTSLLGAVKDALVASGEKFVQRKEETKRSVPKGRRRRRRIAIDADEL